MRVRPLFAALLALLCAAPALAAPPAPGLKVTLLDGSGAFDSRALIGKKILVVRFQASWCKACAEEAPAIERLYARYRARGVALVAIHVQDTEADARRFLAEHRQTYPAGLDPRLAIARRFGFRGTPYTVIVDRRGEIVRRFHGRASEGLLARTLNGLLQEQPRRTPPARLR
jgi:thiol-disulfide isomerase/thioredoxin